VAVDDLLLAGVEEEDAKQEVDAGEGQGVYDAILQRILDAE
jgi:hypothetical protein